MAILLGIDTGGTYTDAVLFDDAADGTGIRAKAKALTTPADLSKGIRAAIDGVLAKSSDISPQDIGLVSLSTTLATNALVERRGGPVCLILIGFDPNVLERAGLSEAMAGDPVVPVAGGHTATGDRACDLDLDAVKTGISEHADKVGAFAVVAHFGVRNPVDERAVKTAIAEQSSLPVTCGYELASDLNGPKRAVTSVLNARLIRIISDLIQATHDTIGACGITAPLMMVRGDGSLVSADFARSRPIETILSGPAASLVGAAHLTGCRDAVISDIGGTTTDIAVLQDGVPALTAAGASVGGFQTMVEAVNMTTHGLGGDSEVAVALTGTQAGLRLGPKRILPISLAAHEFPDVVRSALQVQLGNRIPGEHDARFVIRGSAAAPSGQLSDREQNVLDRIVSHPIPNADVIQSRADATCMRKLINFGLVQQIGFTPTDAAHVLHKCNAWDGDTARDAALLMARKRDGSGQAIRADAETFSAWVIDALVKQSGQYVLNAALSHDDLPHVNPETDALASAGLARHSGAAMIRLGLETPLIGLGASASVYYPAVGEYLSTKSVIPEDADVANAIGAVAGQVRISCEAVMTCPSNGVFRVNAASGFKDFADLNTAKATGFADLQAAAIVQARAAGADEIVLTDHWSEKCAEVEGTTLLIEGAMTVTATGRPKIG